MNLVKQNNKQASRTQKAQVVQELAKEFFEAETVTKWESIFLTIARIALTIIRTVRLIK